MSADELRGAACPRWPSCCRRARGRSSLLVTREHAATFRAAPGARSSVAPPGLAQPGLAGRVDRHRLAGDDGERRAQRTCGCRARSLGAVRAVAATWRRRHERARVDPGFRRAAVHRGASGAGGCAVGRRGAHSAWGRRRAAAATRVARLRPTPWLLIAGFPAARDEELRPATWFSRARCAAPDAHHLLARPAPILAGMMRRGRSRSTWGRRFDASASCSARGRHCRAAARSPSTPSRPGSRPGSAGPRGPARVVDAPAARELHRPLDADRAARPLRRCAAHARSPDEWAAAARARGVRAGLAARLLRGVDRAVETVERALERLGPPLYVRRQIVHNAHVVASSSSAARLRRGARRGPAGRRSSSPRTASSPAVRMQAARARASTSSTPPARSSRRSTPRRGASPRGLGHRARRPRGHEEVEGTLGEAPARTHVVDQPRGGRHGCEVADPERVAYLTPDDARDRRHRRTSSPLRERFPRLSVRVRRHLLRDPEPPGRRARAPAELRRAPRRRLAQLVELAPPRGGGAARRLPARTHRPPARARADLAARARTRGDHRRRLGARGHRRPAVLAGARRARPWRGVGRRARRSSTRRRRVQASPPTSQPPEVKPMSVPVETVRPHRRIPRKARS